MPVWACSSPPSALRESTSPAFSASSTVLSSATTSNLRPAVTLDNPFPTGIQQPTGCRGGTFDVPRPEHYVLQSQPAQPLLHPLELRYPALPGQGHGLRDRLHRQSRRAPDHRSGLELHAGAIPEHVAGARSGGDRPQLHDRGQSVRQPAAGHQHQRLHGQLHATGATVPAVHRRDHERHQRRPAAISMRSRCAWRSASPTASNSWPTTSGAAPSPGTTT